MKCSGDEKVLCSDWRCGWKGTMKDVAEVRLIHNGSEIGSTFACPKCMEIASSIRGACDEADCWKESTCGFPTSGGYRRTCGGHMRSAGE